VAQKVLSAGNWVAQVNVHVNYGIAIQGQTADQADCQLRKNGTDVIGFAVDSRAFAGIGNGMLPMNGGIAIPGGTATVDVWCRGANPNHLVDTQLVAIQVGSFF
jgi:hypothetical protein